MWKFTTYDGPTTTDAKWWQKLTWPLARWAKKKEQAVKTAHNLIANRRNRKEIDTLYTHTHDHSLSLVGTGTSIKLIMVNLKASLLMAWCIIHLLHNLLCTPPFLHFIFFQVCWYLTFLVTVLYKIYIRQVCRYQIGNHKPFIYKTLHRKLKCGHTNVMCTGRVHTFVIILLDAFVWFSCHISN